jgi:hypothetical protein
MEAYRAERHGEGIAACDRNETKRMIAVRFDVSESSMRRRSPPDRTFLSVNCKPN